ncbi:MAG TPA: hypothetical protein VMU99_09880 [Acidimicrobiales bacterium]|nr:hypothetical protein [Acidimicrobiales bacterium]
MNGVTTLCSTGIFSGSSNYATWTCSRGAMQLASASYSSVTVVFAAVGGFAGPTSPDESLTVAQAANTIDIISSAPSNATVGGASYTPLATASSGDSVVVTTSTPLVCTISSGVVNFVGAGSCTLDFSHSGKVDYAAATQVIQTFNVGKGSPSISVSPPSTTPSPGQSAVFTATVSGPKGGATPSDMLGWTITGPGSPSSADSTLLASDSTSSAITICVISGVNVGSYTAEATYLPGTDPNYDGVGPSTAADLTVIATTIGVTPTTGTVTTTGSSTYTVTLDASGGSETVTFAGTPSDGLSVLSAGVLAISGTLAAGTHTITCTASDAYGDQASFSFTLTVTATTGTIGVAAGSHRRASISLRTKVLLVESGRYIFEGNLRRSHLPGANLDLGVGGCPLQQELESRY